MEHFLLHWTSTLSPSDLVLTLRNLMLGTTLLVLFALPSVLVLYSDKVDGKARFAWFGLALLLSWPAYALFALVHARREARNENDGMPARFPSA